MRYPDPVSTLQIQEQVTLAPFTTLGVGGPARFFAAIESEIGLAEAVRFARKHRLPTVALGGGSNLLVHDEGFPGLVLHLTLAGELTSTLQEQAIEYHVPAGLSWDDLVRTICERGASGMECLAGIPGLTGGTPVQNVGAYGQEIAQTVTAVRAFDLKTDTVVTLTREQCRFRYRGSTFNSDARGRYLVTAVDFRLQMNARSQLTYADLRRHFGERQPEPIEVYHAVRAIRGRKGMLLTPGDPDARSAGSFFKNPVIPLSRLDAIAADRGLTREAIVHWPAPGDERGGRQVKLAAAWLVEQAGFRRSFSLGPAGISSKHALALINRGGATCADLIKLRDLVRGTVAATFGVELEQEPVELGPHTPSSMRYRKLA